MTHSRQLDMLSRIQSRQTEWSRRQLGKGLCFCGQQVSATNKSMCTVHRDRQNERMRERRGVTESYNAIRMQELPSSESVRYQSICLITGSLLSSGCYALSLVLLPESFRRLLRFTKGDTCWTWAGPKIINPRYKGGREGHEYGIFTEYLGRANGKAVRANTAAHKFCYETLVRPVPQGLELDHLCENKLCVNPSHLEAVTRQVNVIRSLVRRGR